MRFDIDSYKRRSAPVSLDGVDFSEFERDPLDADSLRCIRYMHDIEHHTICYLRDLLVTPAHRDHEMTTFLTMWALEEYWHGEALGAVLAAHGEPNGGDRVAPMRRRLRLKESLSPLFFGLGSAIAGRSFAAIHMTWGAINEWTAQAAYGRLAQRAGHPTLTKLLKRIQRQEGGHIDFYASQATKRLAGDRFVQRATRFALGHYWAPVGSDVMPDDEVDFVGHHLFSGDEGKVAIDRVDRHVDRLPGLEGLHLMTRANRRLVA
ncbi:MAG TPA: hypothetical protein VMK16_00195 [Acidimicrobiales bacterium]|nr:hypothetical protein [Acidimicrobiales bacterium]